MSSYKGRESKILDSAAEYKILTHKRKEDLMKPVLNQNTNFNWHYEGNVNQERCNVYLDEYESRRPGYYKLKEFDSSCQNSGKYSNKVSEVFHQQKVYGKPQCYIPNENKLIYSRLNNLGGINQLYARPYVGHFAGAGQRSLRKKDLESYLQQGVLTNARDKPCQVTRGTTFHRFQHLPEYGNPQRVQHIVEPPIRVGGWIRSGLNTRDFVRRVDYQRRTQHKQGLTNGLRYQ